MTESIFVPRGIDLVNDGKPTGLHSVTTLIYGQAQKHVTQHRDTT